MFLKLKGVRQISVKKTKKRIGLSKGRIGKIRALIKNIKSIKFFLEYKQNPMLES